ncbi:uncharacterized protein HaLaN_06580, partial [Haematococcus lacustris]
MFLTCGRGRDCVVLFALIVAAIMQVPIVGQRNAMRAPVAHRSSSYSLAFRSLPGTCAPWSRSALQPLAMATSVQGVTVKQVPTKPIDGQKTGTSGLRKKTKEFMSPNYLGNWVQSLFSALGSEVQGQVLGLGGDGRYFGKEAAQQIIKLAAGNGFKKVVVGRDAIMATPAMSAMIRRRKLYGGLIMSASHNPGGPDNDFGIKFNYKGGEPAPESITDKIYGETQKVAVLNMADLPDIDLAKVGGAKVAGRALGR